MQLPEKEREVVLTVVHRFLDKKEPTPHKELLRQCKDPKVIDRLVSGTVLRTLGPPGSYLPRVLAFEYCGDAEILRCAKSASKIAVKVLQNLFDTEMEKENFTVDDVVHHAGKMYEAPPGKEEIALGLFLSSEFANVLKSWICDSSLTQMTTMQVQDSILALPNTDDLWDKHVLQHMIYLEGQLSPEAESVTKAVVGNTQDTTTRDSGLLVFISHSSKDEALAQALIDLLRAGLGLRADQIRCSSVDGYRLSVGVNSESQLRDEVNASQIVIGLITPHSLASYFVMFELGARWGANLFLAPLLAGVQPKELSAPLSFLNALSASNESQLHQLLHNIAKKLGLIVEPPHTYTRQLGEVRSLSATVSRGDVGRADGEKLEAVNVDLTPWRGQFDTMYLTIKNRGAKQTFRAQCTVLARRNDPNPPPKMMFDLKWQYGGRELFLAKGQHANLLVASAGEDKYRSTEWMKLECVEGQHAPDSQWTHGTQSLPEYDVEITILGTECDQPQSESFVVRAGKDCAVEIYHPSVRIEEPAHGTVMHGRECRVKGSVSIPRARVQLLVFAGGVWHPNGNANVKGDSWEGTCWIGDKESTRGNYKIIAVADGDIDPNQKYKWLPASGHRSNEIEVSLRRDPVA